MQRKIKVSKHRHTGKVRPRQDTSYFPLAVLLFVVGIALTIFSTTVIHAWERPGPAAESVSLNGVMPGPPPKTAATIDYPNNGQRFGTSPIDIRGICPPKTLVEIFKNDIFAGSTICTDRGTYATQIDLIIGQNIIIVRVYNDLNEPGPDSKSITVYYDALPPQGSPLTPFDFAGDQMLLVTDAVFRGAFPDQEMPVPISIVGGTPPYAINIQWGDSSNTVVPRNDTTPFNTSHVYKKPGVYEITLQGTDSKGRVAFLRVAAIVNGQPSVSTVADTQKSNADKLLVLWPLYAASVAVVISFWLGEKREKHLFAKAGITLGRR